MREASNVQLAALQSELDHTKESLQAAIEGLETGNEELQTANEELHASNEELLSTNHELQSVNEELYSVNAEHQRKIGELTELSNDVDNLLASTDVGTVFLDRELRVRKFTPQIAERFNLMAQDLGRSIESFTHNMDYPELIADLKRVLISGERIERDVKDRDRNAFFLRILPYRAKGTVQGVVLTLIDVNGLRAAEDALFHERYLLDSLLSNIPDAIYFKDHRGRFIRANHAAAAYFGLSDPSMLVGKTSFDLGDHDLAYALHEADHEVLRTGEAQHYRLERLGSRSDTTGGEWVVTTRLPLKDRWDRIVGVAVIRRDVTKQKRAENRIQEAVNRRDQFLAMLSHELRNPLGAMVTATALLKSGELQAGEGRLVEILDRQSQQMTRLLDDLLEVSRVTQNKIELRKTALDLGEVARDAAEASRSFMEARGVELTVDIDPRALPVMGDAARLQQLQVNLLSNAAKYTPRGGHVQFEVKAEGAFAVIVVKDDGSGIPPDMLEHIFEIFVQSKHTLDRCEGGLGVGLTLVRSLVTMHGGTVTAHSTGVGHGSEFVVVRIPIAATLIDAPTSSRPCPRLPHGARVVIVEDNADSRDTLSQLLGLAGLDCHVAENGFTGLALIEELCPDVAIIDVGLPGMDGFELARNVRKNQRNAEVFMMALTGYGQAADRARALQAGFDEHIVKPVAADYLLGLIADNRPPRRASPGA